MIVLLAPTVELARHVLNSEDVLLTVEAEYGSFVAEGRFYTAAHHQPAGSPFAGTHVGGVMPSPCNDTNIPALPDGGVALISHVDLDTFGGCLRAMPAFADLFAGANQAFWDLAEHADVCGMHRVGEAGASAHVLRQFYAFVAWSKSPAGEVRFPRDQVTDVTDRVHLAGEILRRIFNEDAALLADGDTFHASEEALNRRTFVRRESGVLVRVAGGARDFCNHLYTDPEGAAAQAVASYNQATGAVTVSLAETIPGVSCRAIVQELWGPTAGGHEWVAGSPRGVDVGEEGLQAAVAALCKALS